MDLTKGVEVSVIGNSGFSKENEQKARPGKLAGIVIKLNTTTGKPR